MKNVICITLAILIIASHPSAASAAAAQEQKKQNEQDQTIRLKSELVQVRAVVTDKRGQIVEGLKKEDFEVLENNSPQQISFFSAESISQDRPSEPASLRNLAGEPVRSIVLFVDTVHISFENLAQTKQALKNFVDRQMTGRDVVALVTSGGSLGLLEQFFRDRTLLRAAIDRLRLWQVPQQQSLFSPYLAAQILNGDRQAVSIASEIARMEEQMPDLPEALIRGRANAILAEASYRRKATLGTLKGVVERLVEMPGQRLIAMFSEGFTLSGTGGSIEASDLQPVISRAARSGVVIYSLAAQGLQVPMVSASSPGIVEGRQGFGRSKGSNIERPSLTSYMASADRDQQHALSALAKDTGGEAFFNTNDFNGRLQKAIDDNRMYYALAYHASNESANGKDSSFRRITLRVKGHPEYKIRTQRGYQPIASVVAEQAQTPRQKLIQAMTQPLPVTTIPVSASADYYEREGDDARVSVQVYIDANAMQYAEQSGRYIFDEEIAIAIYDLTGKRAHVSTQEAHGDFSSGQIEAARRNGYRYNERVSLKPGLYQVRAGVLEPATEKIGTATAWVEVPDISKGKLTLSALRLEADRNETSPPQKPQPSFQSLSPAVTGGIRVYKRGESLNYRVTIYPASKSDESGLVTQAEILQGDQPIYQSPWNDAGPRISAKDKKGAEISGRLMLNNLKPGVYELRISVESADTKKPLTRAIFFGVEP